MQKENFTLVAKYNLWMNEKLFAAVAQLNDHDLSQDKGALVDINLAVLIELPQRPASTSNTNRKYIAKYVTLD